MRLRDGQWQGLGGSMARQGWWQLGATRNCEQRNLAFKLSRLRKDGKRPLGTSLGLIPGARCPGSWIPGHHSSSTVSLPYLLDQEPMKEQSSLYILSPSESAAPSHFSSSGSPVVLGQRGQDKWVDALSSIHPWLGVCVGWDNGAGNGRQLLSIQTY